MTKQGEVQITGIIQNILNDSDLEHLSVRDLRNVVLNMQEIIYAEEEEEESDEDLNRYVI